MVVANDILIPELGRLLAEGKEVRFTPSGVSMRPYIEGGVDSVILAPLKGDPKVGDILLAKVHAGGRRTFVLHRLIRIEGKKYVLQGDGNLWGEETCEREEILGKVVKIENAKGRRKILNRGRLWFLLRPVRKWLLKIYRHTMI